MCLERIATLEAEIKIGRKLSCNVTNLYLDKNTGTYYIVENNAVLNTKTLEILSSGIVDTFTKQDGDDAREFVEENGTIDQYEELFCRN